MLLSKKTLSSQRIKELNAFAKGISIKFSNLNLLQLAFTHRSYSNEGHAVKHENNERLEFLGDSVLGMATAAYLYEHFMDNPDGIKKGVRPQACPLSHHTIHFAGPRSQ